MISVVYRIKSDPAARCKEIPDGTMGEILAELSKLDDVSTSEITILEAIDCEWTK